MALDQPRILFGIHSFTPFRRLDHKPYGIAKVIGSASIGMSADLEQLFAGSSKFAWAAEAKTVNAELNVKVKEYPNFLFELFLGAQVTENALDAAGTVEGFVNVKGTTIKDVSNGLASVVVTTAANLKYGKYVLIATAADEADLYILSDIDLARGVNGVYASGLLKISSIDIGAASQNDGATNGLTFTKVGTPAFTVGDTAEFTVRPPSLKSVEIIVGAAGSTFEAFGAYIVAQKRATGEIFTIEAYNLIASGLPIALEEQAFSQPEVKLAALYDSEKDCVFKMKHYTPS